MAVPIPSKRTVFNKLWLDKELYPDFAQWLAGVKGSEEEAFCKKCKIFLNLSNMGSCALVSHAKTKKHSTLMKSIKNTAQLPFSCIVNVPRSTPVQSCNSNNKPLELETESLSTRDNVAETPMLDVRSASSADLCTPSQSEHSAVQVAKPGQSTMTNFVRADDVTKAEVLWSLKCTMSHFSRNSSRDLKDLFQLMFPDSPIARKMSLGSTKLAYTITYGLAPYFHNQLLRDVVKSQKIVVCFDEAFNRVSQRGQMDIIVRFWNDDIHCVSSRYFSSAFMGFSSAKHILATFREALTEVPLTKILQISMDGPSVNWKFIELLRADVDFNSQLIDMGSCGLHTIHGAFQTGHKASEWEVNAYLRALYNLFKDSPARRAAYTEITGSKVFPLKFCQIRWVENVNCAERALAVLPNVKQYVENKPKLPTSVTSTTVKLLCGDKLAAAKIAFFGSVAAQCEPFLKRYQTANPMAPFLYEDIGDLLRGLLKRFVKKSVMAEADSVPKLVKIKVSDSETRSTYKDVDIGVGATKALSGLKISETENLTFRMQCMKYLCATVEKIVERSPLQHQIVRAISCLVPGIIVNNRSIAERRMGVLAQVLYDCGHVTSVAAEKCKTQFSNLCEKAQGTLKAQFSTFTRSTTRLDAFYHSIIGENSDYAELFSVVQLVLILSHGNATVEGGFSINGEMLVENLHEESLIAQRIVYDAVQSAGGLTSVKIDKPLLSYVRGSFARYDEALKRKREAGIEEDKRRASKTKADAEIKELEAKKAKMLESALIIERDIAELKRLSK